MRLKISDKSGCSAAIETLGSELKSFCGADGMEYIWQGVPNSWTNSSPVLFPIVCYLRDDKAIIEGKQYQIECHGFAMHTEFDIRSQKTNELVLGMKATEATLNAYPYMFDFRIRFAIGQGRLDVYQTVTNTGNKTMYYCIGHHPGFRCPIWSDEHFEDYRLLFEKKETVQLPMLNPITHLLESDKVNFQMDCDDTIPLRYSLYQNDALIFDQLQSRSVSLLNSKDHGICVEFPGYSMLGSWTMPDKKAKFVCLEPWNGTCTYANEDDELKHKRGIEELLSGKERTYHMTIRIV